MAFQSGAIASARSARLYSMDQDWIPCDPRYDVAPPVPNGAIADANVIEPPITFAGDLLSSIIQARIRRHDATHPFAITSSAVINYTPGALQTALTIVFARRSAMLGVAASARLTRASARGAR